MTNMTPGPTQRKKQETFLMLVRGRLESYQTFLARAKERRHNGYFSLNDAIEVTKYEAQVEVLEDIVNLSVLFWEEEQETATTPAPAAPVPNQGDAAATTPDLLATTEIA